MNGQNIYSDAWVINVSPNGELSKSDPENFHIISEFGTSIQSFKEDECEICDKL